jgi:apolipoprotein D and lipocalin family protein
MSNLLKSVLLAIGFTSSAAHGQLFPEVVSQLDVNRYLGKWYEVASTKPFFQANCVCVTAEYDLLPDGDIAVTNTCRKGSPDGEVDIAEGTASATNNSAKLNVSFGGFSLPFANYWVVDLAEDYSYAVVSTPFRQPIWILSRTPKLDPMVLEGIYTRLDEGGFNSDAISPTRQAGCNN